RRCFFPVTRDRPRLSHFVSPSRTAASRAGTRAGPARRRLSVRAVPSTSGGEICVPAHDEIDGRWPVSTERVVGKPRTKIVRHQWLFSLDDPTDVTYGQLSRQLIGNPPHARPIAVPPFPPRRMRPIAAATATMCAAAPGSRAGKGLAGAAAGGREDHGFPPAGRCRRFPCGRSRELTA